MTDNTKLLYQVQRPGRYTGCEFNSIVKDPARVKVSFALAFPDVYEVGMSYLGFKILYHILNKVSWVQAERAYAPWVDMEELLRKNNLPLSSLETNKPLKDFDFVGFTLQYELTYSNIINMLDLGKIPVMAKDRTVDHPFIVGGGPCVYNPEPLADFFDFFIVGEGEEVLLELVNCYEKWHENKTDRLDFLKQIVNIDGIYVPSFYQPNYNENSIFIGIEKLEPTAPDCVNKRIVKDINNIDYPTSPIVPFNEIIHDRIMLEVFRGCTKGCRFCQAGIVYRPVRERTPDKLKQLSRELVDNTGYDEISLVSLSTADYSCLDFLLDGLVEDMKKERVSVSLPSLRIDSFGIKLAQKVQQVRKSSLTFAPEAGTQRLRDVINKNVSENNLFEAAKAAFSAGWNSLKLYFMIGLPTETDEDIKGIADLAQKVIDCYKQTTGRKDCQITVSVSSFVPKAWTAFQWSSQNDIQQLREKQFLLKSFIANNKKIKYQYHDAKTSVLEGVFARGDRRLGKVIYTAWQNGAKFDGWSEHFKYDIWQNALQECNLSFEQFAGRIRDKKEKFAWDHVCPAVSKDFLWQEYKMALQEQTTCDCRRDVCTGCGVCQVLDCQVIDYSQKAVPDEA